MFRAVAAFAWLVAVGAGNSALPPIDLQKALEELEKVIGSYPPRVESEQELKQVQEKYDAVLAALNRQLEEKPKDADLVYKRGRLYCMGHNLDVKGAFEAAEKDLKTLLKDQKKVEEASLQLGDLYVNSYPELAPRAEELFLAAQKAHGKDLLQGAQSGLFFAYYYQRRMDKALEQAELLIRNWPNVKEYKNLRDVVLQVLERLREKDPAPSAPSNAGISPGRG